MIEKLKQRVNRDQYLELLPEKTFQSKYHRWTGPHRFQVVGASDSTVRLYDVTTDESILLSREMAENEDIFYNSGY